MLTEVELSLHAILKGCHLCCSEANVGEQFTTDKKKRECRNVLKVTSEHVELVDGLFLPRVQVTLGGMLAIVKFLCKTFLGNHFLCSCS